MGFVRGFLAPFQGAVYVTRQRLLHMVVVPLLLNVALAIGAAFVAGRYWQSELADRAVGSPALGTLLLVVTTALGTIVLFLILQPLLGAIFNDFLCERVEKKVGGEPPKVKLLTSVAQALAHGILKLCL
ncbi:MAG TPA: EI24 domain-containing protein, partial [Polyangia bacterium]|nr:EI24 domain-containing protein [Polyangia bacterium]